MGKINYQFIELTDSSDVYRPGDSVSGIAKLDVEGKLKVKQIRVSCRGQALTKWKRFLHQVHEDEYKSTEIYCHDVLTVYSSETSTALRTGEHKYSFTFTLPSKDLPSSFEGSLGAIRYWVKLETDLPFPGVKEKSYKCFTVLANVDINEPIYRNPVQVTGQKQLSKALGIGDAGTLTCSLSLDRSGCCPGEQIILKIEAKNESDKELGPVKVSFAQIVNYKAGDSTDSITSIIRAAKFSRLGKRESVVKNDSALYVDLVPPSSIPQACQIIQVSYAVLVQVEVPLGQDFELRAPFTVGTIPLGVSLPAERVYSGPAPIRYEVCSAGYQEFSKKTKGFPNLGFYIPRTVFVKTPYLQQATGDSASAAASASPAHTPLAVRKPNTSVAKPPFPRDPPPKYSESAETNHTVPNVVVDSRHLDAPPPTYEEFCSTWIPPSQVPKYQPLAPANGCILMLHFPRGETSLVGEAFNRNTPNLLLHGGKVLTFIPETQLLPLKETAAVLIRFDTERIALSWLKNLTFSNADLSVRWHALTGENETSMDSIGDPAVYTYMTVQLLQHNAGFKQSQSYMDEYKSLLLQNVEPLKHKHGGRTFVSGKVVFACGDWSSLSLPNPVSCPWW
ncbi:hypothetical protein BsWGS_15473 [Bradybaena similaris]